MTCSGTLRLLVLQQLSFGCRVQGKGRSSWISSTGTECLSHPASSCTLRSCLLIIARQQGRGGQAQCCGCSHNLPELRSFVQLVTALPVLGLRPNLLQAASLLPTVVSVLKVYGFLAFLNRFFGLLRHCIWCHTLIDCNLVCGWA
jgi:hypothetical protein